MPLSMLLAAAVDSRSMLIVLGVIALIVLVFLGLKFFRNLFEVITAPGASLKYHGENDHFFYSLMLVLLGGLISALIMVASSDKIIEAYSHYSTKVASDLGAANSNHTYQDVATAYAQKKLDSNFDIYFVQNMIILPFLFGAIWLFIGSLVFIFPKMFQSGVAWVDMVGTTAYSGFFLAIGLGLATPFIIDFVASKVGAAPPSPSPLAIAGCVLMIYGLVLFLMGVANAAEISGGQMIAVILMLVVVLGGLGYWGYSTGTNNFSTFSSKVTSFNPAVGKGME